MSYAQPSPPKIQTDFLAMYCLLFRIDVYKRQAQHHAEDAAAGKGDEYKADHPPDLPLQQKEPVQPQPARDLSLIHIFFP